MSIRRTHSERPCRNKRAHNYEDCYYCWRAYQLDHRYAWIKPEERLLAKIFGEGRFFRIDSDKLRKQTKRNRRENARLLLTGKFF